MQIIYIKKWKPEHMQEENLIFPFVPNVLFDDI